jgi:hypothetical protein
MKTFFTALLAVVALASFAKADRILIYRGYQTGRTNESISPLKHSYILFDLDSLQSVRVQFGGPVVGQLYYSVGTPSAFVYAPITTGATTSQTYFGYGSTTVSTTFNVTFRALYGENVMQNLGGTFSGEYPGSLVYKDYALSGNGVPSGDTYTKLSGLYDICPLLTEESNASDDNLAAATLIVTDFLTKRGFVQE